MRVKPVIMAGGTGKRLWPLSSEDKPKQFKKLSGELTLLQQTLTRNRFLGKPTIITPSKYAPITKKQTDEIGIEIELITEPAQKNTAICAIITALAAEAQGFDLLVLLPSDHYIENEQNYYDTINKTLNYVKNYGICTIGIPINVINTEYGYIKSGLSIAENVYQVDCFIEKPTFEEAKKYFESNEYFWNSGIFIYDVSFFLSLAMSLQPELFEIAVDAYNNAIKTENNIVLDCKKYNEAESISIDHAIMEYICGMVIVKADFSWNDLGTWHSLLQVKQQDMRDRLPAKFTYREEFVGNTSPRTAAYIDIREDASTRLTQKLPLEVEFCRKSNNYCEGQVITSNTTNSFISSNDKLTTVIGLDNVIVIDTVNGLLVADKSKTTEIQELILKVGKS